MRITVDNVLGWLAHGMTKREILDEHPGLEKQDFDNVYAFTGIAGSLDFLSQIIETFMFGPEIRTEQVTVQAWRKVVPRKVY